MGQKFRLIGTISASTMASYRYKIKIIIMKLSILPAALIALALLAQGCVSNKKFNDLQTNYTDLQTKNSELSKKYDESQQGLS